MGCRGAPQPLAGVRELGCNGVNLRSFLRECSRPPRYRPAPGRFSIPADRQCALCRPRSQPARQQRGVRHLFRNRPRHADERPQLRTDARGPRLDHGADRYPFPRRTALAGKNRNGARGREIWPDVRDLRPGGVLGRQMRRVGASGNGADRRRHPQTDARLPNRSSGTFSPGCAAASTSCRRSARPAAPASPPPDRRGRR